MGAGDERPEGWRMGDALVEAVEVMDRLWGFGGWEVTQTHDSLRSYLLEETYELLDAIQDGDPELVREELGDLLLQVLFHSRIAEAAGEFTVDDVAATLIAKLAHRSPHLADDIAGPVDIAEQERAWEVRKAAEKERESCVDGIALEQPALALAEKVMSRARKAGLPDELVPDDLRVVRLGEPTSAEDELRKATLRFVADIRAAESAAHADGVPWGGLDAAAWRTYWSG
ncbi:MazG family protein [Rhodococcus xishaensis]|uniref:Nucleoside triphosphate pyrophosphohydrolase n=1 Tax=Rhodococcus xishaensis TaxID=2487364 RepID=A0A438AVY0_9NOCA|nr:MazG family protein [Rhodococcus xishaensis]RVW02890.1 nucleoside triphosphate pyrophosphohydrolase [Rhodococcus xishaensis]